MYVKLVKEFPITTIIDPFVSEDKSSFVELKRVLNPDDGNRSSKKHKVQILVRDSLIVKGNIDYWTSDDAITGIILHSTTVRFQSYVFFLNDSFSASTSTNYANSFMTPS